ncbi:Rid family hydrolase [Halobellus sp. GM3]|uniref:Rid family hydrolase n=1 Tax=Halobellus sp. GM3 TaxID=3458410 RepID=UPI00403D5EE2
MYEKLPDGLPVASLYSQVVRTSRPTRVHIAGTVAVDDEGDIVGEDDMAAQVRQVVKNIENSLAAADADMSDVVRTRVYTVDIDRYLSQGVDEFQVAFDGNERPASTLVGVDELAVPEYLVEIEATAAPE